MQPSVNRGLRISLIIGATLLSAFNGILSMLTVLIFSDNESTRLWASIVLPAFLWITALACFKFRLPGAIGFFLLLGIALFLCVDPLHHVGVVTVRCRGCASNLRFALLGGALLLINLVLPGRSTEPPLATDGKAKRDGRERP
jgi:hypothetical protein